MTVNSGNRDMYRFKAIHDCLRGKTNPNKLEWDKAELAVECESYLKEKLGEDISVNPDSLRKTDLKNMRAIFNAPIEMIKRDNRTYYRYSNPHFTFNSSLFFEESDWKSLLISLKAFKSKVKNDVLQKNMDTAIGKLCDLLSFYSTEELDFVIFENQEHESTKQEWLAKLIELIRLKRPINLGYCPRYKEEESFEVSPFLLKEYKNQWYLIAKDNGDKKIKSFALDRIRSIKQSNAEFLTTNSEELARRYKHIIGITNLGESIEKIRLKVTHKQYPYLESHPLHWTQRKVNQNSEFVEIELNLMINYELKALILSYSRDIIVVSPESLVEEIELHLSKALSYYLSR